MSGFRLQVEEALGKGGDDSALNGIQLLCKDGTATEKIEGIQHRIQRVLEHKFLNFPSDIGINYSMIVRLVVIFSCWSLMWELTQRV